MPVENERKYVLRHSPELEGVLRASGTPAKGLRQGYLPGDARIRGTRQPPGFFEHSDKETYTFTYKIMVGADLIEIESFLSREDFEKLWPITEKRLMKTRFVFKETIPWGHFVNRSVQWDIDLFYDGAENYFAMAECEMPYGMDEFPLHVESPDGSPSSIVKKFLRYQVDRSEQIDFTNTKLADREYADSVLNTRRILIT